MGNDSLYKLILKGNLVKMISKVGWSLKNLNTRAKWVKKKNKEKLKLQELETRNKDSTKALYWTSIILK